nr:hypothetical protein [Pandoravirus massiliensis]
MRCASGCFVFVCVSLILSLCDAGTSFSALCRQAGRAPHAHSDHTIRGLAAPECMRTRDRTQGAPGGETPSMHRARAHPKKHTALLQHSDTHVIRCRPSTFSVTIAPQFFLAP